LNFIYSEESEISLNNLILAFRVFRNTNDFDIGGRPLNGIRVQWSQKNVLETFIAAGVIRDVSKGRISVNVIHENVEFVEHPEGRLHFFPESQDQRNSRVTLFSSR